MQYFKKFPLFFTITLALVLVFIAGVAYNVMLASDVAKAEKKLRNSRSDFEVALSEDPTQKAIDAAGENIKKLEVHLSLLEKDLTRAHGDIFSAPPAEPYQLVEQLRGMVQKWKRSARGKGIALASGMDFGFKNYVAPNAEPPEEKAVAPVWKQACVLNYINTKLFDCKTLQSPVAIVNVQREILAEEGGKKPMQTRRLTARERRQQARMAAMAGDTKGETFTIDPNITARKKGSLDTLAYRFTFAGHTDILRRFLNKLKDFDAMLVVRSIDVKPADDNVNTILNRKSEDEETEGLADIFGDSNTSNSSENAEAPAENAEAESAEKIKTPVVSDNLSEFTVVIEYVEVVKEPEVKKVKKEEE